MVMSELKQRLLKIELARLGFPDTQYDNERGLLINPSNERVMRVMNNGEISYYGEHDYIVLNHIFPAVKKINEAVAAWENAPAVKFEGLSNYRILSEYNNTVLAARDDSERGYDHGLFYTTWEYSNDRAGFLHGHYTSSYEAAKEDFAVRCGLINRYRMFNETELKLIHQGLVHLGANYPHFTSEQMTNVGKIIEKIELIIPAIKERSVYESHELVPEDGLEI